MPELIVAGISNTALILPHIMANAIKIIIRAIPIEHSIMPRIAMVLLPLLVFSDTIPNIKPIIADVAGGTTKQQQIIEKIPRTSDNILINEFSVVTVSI